ncbi:MAG: hypothetical protein EOO43_21315 [Flavobacterium sp.]|nr:MAG: hypothetical protein EOO43_21315 [Flavobacterium sp.]
MNPQVKLNQQQAYNSIVKDAYYAILKKVKQQLSTIEQHELRYSLEREDKSISIGTIIHEIITPLIYLRLEFHTDNVFAIHFGIEPVNQQGQLSSITTSFIRLLYKLTCKENTAINIEDCVRTDWFINSCSDMYQYLEERGNKHHTFKQLPYKPAIKRKLRSVA